MLFANLSAFLLMAEGFNVRQHESAMTFLKMTNIDGGCIVTDVRMPEIKRHRIHSASPRSEA